jgi:ubiquinone/menaquinone biosynthesis C-methylase UbiE
MSDLAATRAFYGRWAGLYDALATAPGVASWRRRAVDALALSPGDTVVEMGCGSGANLPLLRDAVGPTGTVVGVDVTRELLDVARDRAAAEGWSNVHCIQADAREAPLAGDVDAVLASFVVGMLSEPGAAVAEWCALCGPGGRVALLNFQRSGRPLALPLRAAFEAFVWLSAPSGSRSGAPSAGLERRVVAARAGLVAETVDRRFETFGAGFLGLLSGSVPDSDGRPG